MSVEMQDLARQCVVYGATGGKITFSGRGLVNLGRLARAAGSIEAAIATVKECERRAASAQAAAAWAVPAALALGLAVGMPLGALGWGAP